MPKEDSQSRVEIVEALRGFAALAVAWFHFTNGTGLLGEGWLKTSGSYGWLGVEVFFVISGFIIPYSMYVGGFRFPSHIATFLWKRLLRLEPPYLASLLLVVLLWFLSAALPGYRGVAPKFEALQVALHAGYLAAIMGYEWLNPVFWSLAIEFQFYLLAAVSYPLILHNSRVVRYISIGLFCSAALAFPAPLFVFKYSPLFALGIITAWRFLHLESTRSYWALVAVAAAAAVPVMGVPIAVTGVATSLLIAFTRVRRVSVLAFLGGISYSLYLLHVPFGGRVVNLGSRFADTLSTQVLVLAGAMSISLIAAYLMYKVVEGPARRWSSAVRYKGESPVYTVVPSEAISK